MSVHPKRSGPAASASPESGQRAGPGLRGRRELTSADLLAGSRELRIRHADDVYTLRLTSKGKLILTK